MKNPIKSHDMQLKTSQTSRIPNPSELDHVGPRLGISTATVGLEEVVPCRKGQRDQTSPGVFDVCTGPWSISPVVHPKKKNSSFCRWSVYGDKTKKENPHPRMKIGTFHQPKWAFNQPPWQYKGNILEYIGIYWLTNKMINYNYITIYLIIYIWLTLLCHHCHG
jgi:hypothetical protein